MRESPQVETEVRRNVWTLLIRLGLRRPDSKPRTREQVALSECRSFTRASGLGHRPYNPIRVFWLHMLAW